MTSGWRQRKYRCGMGGDGFRVFHHAADPAGAGSVFQTADDFCQLVYVHVFSSFRQLTAGLNVARIWHFKLANLSRLFIYLINRIVNNGGRMTKYKLMAAAAVLCMAAGADARAEEKSGKSDLRANFQIAPRPPAAAHRMLRQLQSAGGPSGKIGRAHV